MIIFSPFYESSYHIQYHMNDIRIGRFIRVMKKISFIARDFYKCSKLRAVWRETGICLREYHISPRALHHTAKRSATISY